MLRGLLRVLFVAVVIYFALKFIQNFLKALVGTSDEQAQKPPPKPQNEARTQPQIDLRDVKDASFKDLPNESTKS